MNPFRISFAAIFLLLLLFVVGCSQYPWPNTIDAEIREEIGKPYGKLTKEDYAKVISLSAGGSSKELTSINGIEKCTNLTYLSLWGNKIVDISPLENLQNLKTLNLGGNIILKNEFEFHTVSSIRSFVPLGKLISLEELNLPAARTKDLGFLENLTNLKILNLSGNNLDDLSVLTTFTKLESLKLIGGESLLDFESLSELKNLKKLEISVTEKSSSNPNLALREIGRLENLEHMWLIILNESVDLTPLAELNNLLELRLSGRCEMDFAPLARMQNLENLSLRLGLFRESYNRDLTSLSKSESLTSLTLITIGDDTFELEPIPNLKKLKIDIGFRTTSKIDLKMIAQMQDIEEISVDLASVSDLSSFSNLKNLKTLWIEGGGEVVDLSPLSNLEKLEHLGLPGNQITDLTSLLNIKSLIKLDVRGNRLDEKSINEVIPALKERGVEIQM